MYGGRGVHPHLEAVEDHPNEQWTWSAGSIPETPIIIISWTAKFYYKAEGCPKSMGRDAQIHGEGCPNPWDTPRDVPNPRGVPWVWASLLKNFAFHDIMLLWWPLPQERGLVHPLSLLGHPSGTSLGGYAPLGCALGVPKKARGDVPNPLSFGRGHHNLSLSIDARSNVNLCIVPPS